jgi:hypothetical protein
MQRDWEITPKVIAILQASQGLAMQIKSPEKLRELFIAFCGIAAVRPNYSVMEWLQATKTHAVQKGLVV